MEENETVIEKSKSPANMVMIILASVILAGIVSGGAVYAYQNNKTKKDQEALKNQITALKEEKANLELASSQQNSSANNNSTTSEVSQATGAQSIANWKVYENSEFGFSFKYPADAFLGSPAEKGYKGRVITVRVEPISQIEDRPLGYDKENAQKDLLALKRGDVSVPVGQGIVSSSDIIKGTSYIGKKVTSLGQIEVCSRSFYREAIIYQNDQNRIIIHWEHMSVDDLTNANSSYFIVDQNNCGDIKMWEPELGKGNFEKDVRAGKTDPISQTWYNDFEKIIASLTFTK